MQPVSMVRSATSWYSGSRWPSRSRRAAAGVRRSQQRPVAVAAGAAEQLVHAGPQIDHDALLLACTARFSAGQDRAAPGGQNDVAPRGALAKGGGFSPAETGLALDFENDGHTHTAADSSS